MKEKLKLCPFCDGKAEVMIKFDDNNESCFVVDCERCWASTHLYEKRIEAIKAWNTRAKEK